MQESEKDQVLNDTERQQVENALEAILATEKFDAAPQMSAFLRYVVEQAADGQQSRIKAFTVAVDALGKPDTFDPQNDPVVRVLAGRLRAALTAYNNDNPDVPLIIKMTPGSYVPIFEKRDQALVADNISADAESLTSAEQQRSKDAPAAQAATDITQDATAGGHQANGSSLDANGKALPTPIENSSLSDVQQPSHVGFLGALLNKLAATPTMALTGVLVAAVAVAMLLQSRSQPTNEPDMQAAEPGVAVNSNLSERLKPDIPSVFISAIDEGNKLENSLNALVSGVISESENIGVYRILDKQSDIKFWPDEYILTITALDLPDETRVDLQLMDASTGQIVHSQAISLNENASDQLTQDELTRLTDAARLIVADDGPLARLSTWKN